MSERWGDSARDRARLDAWITREPVEDYWITREPVEDEVHVNCANCGEGLFMAEPDADGTVIWDHLVDADCDDPVPKHDPFEELDPVCGCGLAYTDHSQVQVTDEQGNDYETYECAKCFVCGVPLTNGRAHKHTLREVLNTVRPGTITTDS